MRAPYRRGFEITNQFRVDQVLRRDSVSVSGSKVQTHWFANQKVSGGGTRVCWSRHFVLQSCVQPG
jgi:hypothetical protein